MTTDKPTPELLPCPLCRDRSGLSLAADKIGKYIGCMNCLIICRDIDAWNTRPSELRQAGVDGIDLTEWHDFASKISDMLWGGELGWTRTGLGGMLAVLKERIEQADDFKRETLASIIHSEDNYQEQLTALQPAAQKTEGVGEASDALPYVKAAFDRLAAIDGAIEWSEDRKIIEAALASRASVDVEDLKREFIGRLDGSDPCTKAFATGLIQGIFDDLAAKFPELVGGRDGK